MNKRHSLEEKQNAIKRYVKDRESPLTIIKDIGISKSTFYKWLSEDQDKQKQSDRKNLTLRNFKLLEAKIARLEGVIEIIKKNKRPAKFAVERQTIRGRKHIR